MVTDIDVAIVGGGISGLTLAFDLTKAGVRTKVFETQDRIGGALWTEVKRDYLLEYGPNSALTKADFLSLVEESGASEILVPAQKTASKRFLLTDDNELQAVPMHPLKALASPILSSRGKLRILGDLFVRRSTREDESVQTFIGRHFGREVSDRVVAALLGGIWAADISQLSCRSALPLLWEIEQNSRSVLLGAFSFLRKRAKAHRGVKPRIVSFKDGMGSFARHLAAALPEGCVVQSTAVDRITLGQELLVGIRHKNPEDASNESFYAELSAKVVVLTGAAERSASLIDGLFPLLASRIRSIPYAPLGIIHLAYPAQEVTHPLDGFGFLAPPHQDRILLGALFNSSLFPGRAPEGFHLVTCFVGGNTKPQLSDVTNQEIRQKAVLELGQAIGARRSPEILEYLYWKSAIPNYPLGHFQTQQQLFDIEQQEPRLRFLTNWRSGISVPDRVLEARALAKELIKQLS